MRHEKGLATAVLWAPLWPTERIWCVLKGKKSSIRKSIILSLTAAVWGSVLYLYLFENVQLYASYRCLGAAPRWYYCFEKELRNFEFTTDFYGMRYEGNTENLIDQSVLLLGAYEKPILYFMRDVMQLIYSNQGVFLDVGANVGQHSLFMSRYVKEIHAFEPYEPVVKRFRRMKELNNIENIVIHPVGLGNEKQKLLFYEPPETNPGQGSFLKDLSSKNRSYKELEIVVGDEMLEKIDAVSSVSLIKVDVEGYERPVLEGLSRTLEAKRPIVVFEIHVIPTSSFGFRNEIGIRKVFPKNYEFLVFGDLDNPYTGSYQLSQLSHELDFDKLGRYNVVAYPLEKRELVPRTNHHQKPKKRVPLQ